MRAIVYEKYGPPDVLRFEEVDKPVPKEGEVLVRVHAASLNPYDWRLLRADPFLVRITGGGFFKPKHHILGSDIAGRVEAVGSQITQFRPGDEVFGASGHGGFAEYDCVREKGLVLKPADVTFEEAAAVPIAALTALQGLRDTGNIRAGQKVLINGASGGVGTYAVQISKSFGTEVTGVCRTSKMDLVRSIGADQVIDYTQEDVTAKELRYDLIFDVAAYRPVSRYKKILSPGGVYVLAGGSVLRLLRLGLASMVGVKNMKIIMARVNQADLRFMADLLKEGKVKSIIDKRFPLSETADAVRYLESGHARGKVVITIP
jgi:NADPH:quinone reductase-like Zn-dependent oxidoreductase